MSERVQHGGAAEIKIMTKEQEEHLAYVLAIAKSLISTKYRAGQKKHGGNLFDKTPAGLCDEAINEAIDQLVYLTTLRQKLHAPDIQSKLHSGKGRKNS